jgi:hypothetical protein
MTKQVLVAFGAAVLAVVVGTQASHADTVAVTFDTTTGLELGNGPFTLGFEFQVNAPINVTQLGAFDDSQDGLNENHDVGIWNSVGVLQVSATVAAGTVDPLTNQFRYVSVAPVTLGAGTYYIGALWVDGADYNTFPDGANSGFATAPQITFVSDSYVAGGALADPTNLLAGGPAYFGPNFQFVASSAVPLPASVSVGLSMLAGFGVLFGLRKGLTRTPRIA